MLSRPGVLPDRWTQGTAFFHDPAMSDSAVTIANLLYHYCELMDGGKLREAAALFRHARVKVAGQESLVGEAGLLEVWRRYVRIYPDGTPRTKHIVSNPIIEIDGQAGQAKVRSYYSVYQATDELPLQLIAAGRYHDEFERVDGAWRFTYRDYSMLDLKGNLKHHLKLPA